jgi:hypothetical protein
MNLGNVFFMLLGAGLVMTGFLGSALADRIRGVSRPTRETARRSSPAIAAADPVLVPAVAPKPRRTPAPRAPSDQGGDDVIAALVAAGYKKALATEATWSCEASDRATIEAWTRAALRRCSRGGMAS